MLLLSSIVPVWWDSQDTHMLHSSCWLTDKIWMRYGNRSVLKGAILQSLLEQATCNNQNIEIKRLQHKRTNFECTHTSTKFENPRMFAWCWHLQIIFNFLLISFDPKLQVIFSQCVVRKWVFKLNFSSKNGYLFI